MLNEGDIAASYWNGRRICFSETDTGIPDYKEPTDHKRWQIGDERYIIWNKDSREILRCFTTIKVQMVLTSPPYANNRKDCAIPAEQYAEWFKPFGKLIYDSLSPTGIFVLNIDGKIKDGNMSTYQYEVVLDLKKLGFIFIDDIRWDKMKGMVNVNMGRPARFIEHCFVFAKGKPWTWNPDPVRTEYSPQSIKRMQKPIIKRYSRYEHDTIGGEVKKEYKEWKQNPLGAYPKNIIHIGSEGARIGKHTSVFPVGLADWFIKAFTNEGDDILDPFGGMFTTVISAIRNKRSAIGIEINKEFYDEGCIRIQKEIDSIANK